MLYSRYLTEEKKFRTLFTRFWRFPEILTLLTMVDEKVEHSTDAQSHRPHLFIDPMKFPYLNFGMKLHRCVLQTFNLRKKKRHTWSMVFFCHQKISTSACLVLRALTTEQEILGSNKRYRVVPTQAWRLRRTTA